MARTQIDPSLIPSVQRLLAYRKPLLQWSSITQINLETGLTGTSGQAAILFPDGNYRTDSSTTHINFVITRNAALSGSAQSGLRTSLSEANNTWYSFYAVKVTDSSTDFVVVGDTLTPVQANYSSLNSNFGTNGWVYLGCIPNGDNAGLAGDIPNFIMSGNKVVYQNSLGAATTNRGLRLANTAGATGITWTYASGTALGSAQVPSHILTGDLCYTSGGSVTTYSTVDSSGTIFNDLFGTQPSAQFNVHSPNYPLPRGVTLNVSNSVALSIILQVTYDNVLGAGSHPLL